MRLELAIDVKQTGNGFDVVSAGLRKVEAGAAGAGASVDKLNRNVGSGTSIGTTFVGTLENMVTNLGAVAAISATIAPAAALGAALKTGVEFNALLESSRIGLASIVASTADLTDADGKRLGVVEAFNEADKISIDLQRQLKIEARETAATYEELLSGLQAVLVTHRGAFDTSQVVKFTKELSAAAAAVDPMLLKEGQFAQEIRGVLEGDMSRASRLARIIFADWKGSAADLRVEMDKLRKEGKLFDFLHERLAAFAEGGERSLTTLNTSMSNFKDAFQQAMGEGTEELTQALASALNQIVDEFSYVDAAGHRAFDPDLIQAIKDVSSAIIDVVKGAAAFVGLLKDIKDVAKEFMRESDQDILTKNIDRLNVMKRDLKMGSWTSGERAAMEAEMAKLRASIDAMQVKVRPQTDAGRSLAEDFLKQTAGGADLQRFTNLASAGQRLMDLANDDAQRYLATLREIKAAAKDGVLTYMEFANAFEKARRSQDQARKLGTPGVERIDPDKTQKAAEAEARRAEAVRRAYETLTQFVGAQRQSIDATMQQTTVGEREMEVLRARHELDMLSLTTTGDRLGLLRQQATLQERVNAAERDRAGAEAIQRETAEEARHLEALSRIAEMQARLNRERDEYALSKGKKGTAPEEAEQQQRLINSARMNEERQHDANRKSNERQTQADLTRLAQQGEHDRAQNAIDEWREVNRFLIGMYDDLNRAVVSGARDTVDALFGGESLLDAFDGLVRGVREAWSNALAGMLDEWMQKLAAQAAGKPLTDAQGNPLMAMPGGQRGAQWAYTGLQGATALYGLYQQGQAGATPGQNAISGMMSGAAIGGQVGGVAGAVIGLIIGGVFGALTGKEKAGFRITSVNGKISITGGGSASQADIDDALRAMNIMIANTRESMIGLLDAFPVEISKALFGQFADVDQGDIFGNFDIGKQQWKNWLAKQFGSLGKAMRGMLSPEELKRWMEIELPNIMFDAYAPIISAGLADLGVAEEKIKELLNKGPGFDAKQAIENLRQFVTVLVGFIDSDAFNKLSGADLMARAVKEIGKTPIDVIRGLAEEMTNLAVGFNDLTSEEQVKRGERILDLEDQRQQAVLQYMYELKQAQDSLIKSINAQVRDIDFDQLGPLGQRGALLDQMAETMGQIATAATPQELQALGAEYQSLVARVYELTSRLPKELRSMIDSFGSLDEILAPDKSPFQRLADIQVKIADAYNRMTSATNTDDQIAAARELYALTEERYTLERQMLNEINAAIENINASLDKQIRDFGLEARITEAQARGASPEEIANIRVSSLLEDQRRLRDQLGQATTAEEINRIVAEMQQNANELFTLMGKTPEAAAQLTQMLEDMRTIANEKLRALAEAIAADDQANRDRISAAIGVLETALGTLPAAAAEAKAALEELRVALALRFTELTDQVVAANTGILEIITNILDTLRNGLAGIFTNPPTGGGKPIDPELGDGALPHAATAAYSYTPPQSQAQAAPVIVVDVGQPVTYVQVSGTAERLIDQIASAVEMRATRRAMYAQAASVNRKGEL